MTATRDNSFTVYRVRGGRGNDEWATIAISGWRTSPDPMCGGVERECGEILIRSSFGTWGYYWGHLGTPFRRWLLTCQFDYVFTKFMGTELERFDGDATLAQIRKDIIEQRRRGGLSKDEAREALNEVSFHADRISSYDETAFGYAMWDVARGLDSEHPMRDYFNDPTGWPRCRHDDLQAVGFWRDLWPEFVSALRVELEAKACPA